MSVDRPRGAEGGSSLVRAKPRHSCWVRCRSCATSTPGLRGQLLRRGCLHGLPWYPLRSPQVFLPLCVSAGHPTSHTAALFKTRHLRQQKIKSVFLEVLTHNTATHISRENTLKMEAAEMEEQVREASVREEIQETFCTLLHSFLSPAWLLCKS